MTGSENERPDDILDESEHCSVLAVVKAIYGYGREDCTWPCDVLGCLNYATFRVTWVIGTYGERGAWYCDEHRPPGEVAV